MSAKGLERYLDQLGFAKYYKNPLMEGLSQKLNQKSSLVFTVLLGILALVLIFSALGGAILSFLSFFFPAYQTFKAMESSDTKLYSKMLLFWTMYGSLHLLDKIAFFFPFYKLIRTGVTVYLYMNDYQGAERIYESLLRERLRPHIQRIGEFIGRVEEKSEILTQSLRKRE